MFSTFSSSLANNRNNTSLIARNTSRTTIARNDSKVSGGLSTNSQFSRHSYGSGLNNVGGSNIIPKFGEDMSTTLVPKKHRRNLINSIQKFFKNEGNNDKINREIEVSIRVRKKFL